MNRLLLTSLLCALSFFTFGQGSNCATADPFCTGSPATFPAGTNVTDASVADPGNNYGCLGSSPNPAWYYMEIDNPGAMELTITNSNNVDVDFILYGPFNNYADAMANCGDMGASGSGNSYNNIVDCSFSPVATEIANIPNSSSGDVYVLLITNFSNSTTNISFTNTSGPATTDCSIVNPCQFTGINATIGACNPATGNYTTTGTITYVDPPATGQLIVEDCNGNQQVFNSGQFTGSNNFTISNQIANGGPCNITAYFTADPTCTINLGGYTAPQCGCLISSFAANISACNPTDNTYEITGTVEFQSPPASGTLIVEDCNGNQQTFPIPGTTSPVNYALSGLNSDGAACDISVYFSANPACSQIIPYTAPANCVCSADIGSFSDGTIGSTNNSGPWNLCAGDALTISSNLDNVPSQDFSLGAVTYDPGMWLLAYSCPPTVLPSGDILTDSCLLGVASSANGSWSITNTPVDGSTIYYVPVTMYSMVDGIYAISINGGNWCYDLGPVYEVTFLPQITSNGVEDCQAGTATVTLSGGDPQTNGTNFTISNLSPASASLSTTTVANNGTVTISGLQDGDTYSFDVTDVNGCPHTFTGGPFVAANDATFNLAGPFCQGDPAFQIIAADPGGTWIATCGTCVTPTGFFNPTAAGLGTHTVTYTIPGVCGGTTSQDITVNPSPSVNYTVDSNEGCVPHTVNFTDLTNPPGGTYQWNFGDGNSSATVGDVAHTYNTVGCFDVSLTVTTAQGCVNDATILSMVCVNDIAVANFTFSPTETTVLSPAISFTNLSSNASVFEWTFDQLGTSGATNPSFTFPDAQAGAYQVCLAALNAEGCHDTTCQIVTILDEFLIYVPNAFSPDGDDVNDVFLPVVNAVIEEEYRLYIFDRWGELIFESQLKDLGWDGTYKGFNAKSDVYVWKIVLTDNLQNKREFVGHVTLLR